MWSVANLWLSKCNGMGCIRFKPLSLPVMLALTALVFLHIPAALAASEGTDASVATSATQNFLTGTSSFILGLSISNASKLTATMNRYFGILILATVIPSIVIIVYGIAIVGSALGPGDEHCLLLLFLLFVPTGAILFLLSRIHNQII
jgi:hypothetical protein